MGLMFIIQSLAVAFLALAAYAAYRALSKANEEVADLRINIRSLRMLQADAITLNRAIHDDVIALRAATARIETTVEDNTRTMKKLGLVAAANSLTELAASVRAQIEATQWIAHDRETKLDQEVKR